jgi:hypothetical protein
MARDISLLGFIGHLAGLHLAVEHELAHDLTKGLKLIQAASQATIGEYQQGNDQFGDWPELAERTQEERAALGFAPDDPLLRNGELYRHILIAGPVAIPGGVEGAVGVPSESVGDGSPENRIRDIGEVAIDMEMGVPGHTPARSFLGLPAARVGPKLAEATGFNFAMRLAGTGLTMPIKIDSE